MTATYTFDVFSSLDGFGSASGGDGAATGASRAPSCSITASPYTRPLASWSRRLGHAHASCPRSPALSVLMPIVRLRAARPA